MFGIFSRMRGKMLMAGFGLFHIGSASYSGKSAACSFKGHANECFSGINVFHRVRSVHTGNVMSFRLTLAERQVIFSEPFHDCRHG